MQPDESLLICCKSFSKACESRYLNITVRKIPKMLLGRCEFGKEDYSLNIVNLPVDRDEGKNEYHESNPPIPPFLKGGSKKYTKKNGMQQALFTEEKNEK